MASLADRTTRFSATPLLALVVTTAVLYLAREVIIPLALAMLFSFLLAPAARRFEALHLGRVASTLIVVALFVGAIGAIGWVAGKQVVSLAGKLPEYKDNISHKLRTLHSPPTGDLGKAAQALKEIEKEASAKAGEAAEKPPAQKPPPAALPTTAFELIGTLGVSLLALLAMAVAVIVITALILLQRDDLRERLMRLVGESQIHLTTQAMEDAAQRVTRYLLSQLVVNCFYGLPLGVALYFIGIPNALLWGLLATVLRFIPYLGASIAAALPIALALAISDGWTLVAWTAGIIAILEFTVAYVIEPWLYSGSTGLSPIAIVLSAIFWTWLWGPLGLLLATPLTVCIAVAGRHIPQLGFLNIILGVEPVLPPEARLYQRLVAFEYDEAIDVAEEFLHEHGLPALYEQVVLPALVLAKRDRQRDALDESRQRFVFDGLQRIVEELDENGRDAQQEENQQQKESQGQTTISAKQSALSGPAPALCIVPAHDEADYIAGLMLARLLAPEHFEALLAPKDILTSETLERIAVTRGKAVLVSAVAPSAAANATYYAKHLRSRFPQQKIVVALWNAGGNLERVTGRLRAAGADEVVTRLSEAVERARGAAPVRGDSRAPRKMRG
jgi:predicted PurR-regulated permease PerM